MVFMPRKRIVSKLYKFDCGYCGEPAEVVKPAHLPKPKYCCHFCYGESKRLPFRIKNGYKVVYTPGHIRADQRGYVREHLLIMEKKIGRPVEKTESVHHIDGDKLNNSPDNLELFKSHSDHLRHEWENGTLRNVNLGEHRSCNK